MLNILSRRRVPNLEQNESFVSQSQTHKAHNFELDHRFLTQSLEIVHLPCSNMYQNNSESQESCSLGRNTDLEYLHVVIGMVYTCIAPGTERPAVFCE